MGRDLTDNISGRFIQRWRELAAELGLDAARSERVGDHLMAQYSNNDRHYHGMGHIVSMLEGFDAIEADFKEPLAAELAIFFHDVIYDPSRRDNEEQSAKKMIGLLGGRVDHGLLESAARSIEATRQHALTASHDANLLVDLDMAILGQPWPVYERYADGVMREYLPVYGEMAYRHGRRTLFLEPTIAHGAVFLTEAFQSLNPQAIRNMQREIDILKSGKAFESKDEG
jgi:predicted metal-dependent HD superfamily phosphohydrolase